MAQHVERRGVYLVKPRVVSPSWVHSLTNLDLITSTPEYIEIVLFFRECVTPFHGEREAIQELKTSLSKALSEFPVLAGRMNIGEAGKMAVNVNSQGVNFIESSCDAKLNDWSDLRQCALNLNLSLEAGVLDVSQAPILQIQATIFRCGGLALGFHFLPGIIDGFSLVHFFKSWSEIHRGQKMSIFPSYDIEVFKPRSPPAVDTSPTFLVNETTQKDATCEEFDDPSQYESVVLRIGKESVDACVREVETGNFSYGKPTSYEAVSALLWSSVTRARNISEELDTAYMFAINLRGKFSHVPGAYFGNAIVLSQAYSKTAGSVINDKSYAARLIHDRIKSCNIEGVRSTIDWAEMHSPAAVMDKLHWKRGVLSTSLGGFPVYDTNFGWSGGPLSQICLLPSGVPPSFVATFPAPPSTGEKGLDVHVRLNHAHKDNLLKDASFVKFFSSKEITMWSANSFIRKALRVL